MAISVTPTNAVPHRDNVLRTLRHLVDDENQAGGAVFVFDVPLKRYAVLALGDQPPVDSGDLTLAVYNDMKVSQYIVEDDNLTTPSRRRFWLTERGRRVAALPSAA